MQRKTLKAEARKTLKRHYWLLIIVCLFAAFLSADYGSSPAALNTNMNPNAPRRKPAGPGNQIPAHPIPSACYCRWPRVPQT